MENILAHMNDAQGLRPSLNPDYSPMTSLRHTQSDLSRLDNGQTHISWE